MTELRVAVFSPLAPQRSGIAENSATLLPVLAQHVQVTAVVEDWMIDLAAPMAGVRIVALSDYVSRRDEWDVAMYHMGNDFSAHHWIYRELLQRPGVTLLHDLDLSGFYSHVARVAADLPNVAGTGLSTLAIVVDHSRATLVHGELPAQSVARRFPAATVWASHLARVGIGSSDQAAAVLQACGWGAEQFVVGALGSIVPHKRIDLALRAVASLHRYEPAVRLLIAGWAVNDSYLRELERLTATLGIGDIVRIVTDADDELAGCVLASDVVIDLRDDVTGASSGIVLTALANGRPVILPDLAAYAHMDTPGLIRVGRSARDAVVDATDRLRDCMHDRPATRRLGAAAAEWMARGPHSLTAVAAQHTDVLRRACVLPDPPPSLVPITRPARRRDQLGELTVVGDLTATTGLMEFCRSLVNVLDQAGYALDHFHNPCHGAAHSNARDTRHLAQRLPRRREADVELWLPNINEFAGITEATLRPGDRRRTVIAVWAWELPVLQPEWSAQVARVDEIWVSSPFVARAMQHYSSVPIVVIPAPINVDVLAGITRHDFGLDDPDTIYFFDFDANSTAARKNPFALIEAFRRAFTDETTHATAGGKPVLVIKGTNFHQPHHRPLGESLRAQLARVGGVLIDAELSRGEMNALLACADVYATMHRSEGLGLGMLEAMYLGKPVISPAYPNKWLFPLADVGCAVRSPLRPISDADHAFSPGPAGVYTTANHWTEPDVNDAARWMRLLYDDAALRGRLGRRAAVLVRQYYSSPAALAAMQARLALHLGSDERVEDAAVVDRLVAQR